MGLKDKVQDAANQNPDKVEKVSDQGLQKGADAIDKKTGGQHSDKIQKGEQAADQRIGDNSQ